MTMITPSYLGETIEYSSLHACRSTLEDPTLQSSIVKLKPNAAIGASGRQVCVLVSPYAFVDLCFSVANIERAR